MRDLGLALVIIPLALIAGGFFAGLVETMCSGDIKDDINKMRRNHNGKHHFN